MKLSHVVALLLAALPAPALAQFGAPPPPIPSPPEFDQPIDGYDMRTPYQLWRYQIEAQKGAAADDLLAAPETIAGERLAGAPLLRVTSHNDFGHYMTLQIQAYCTPMGAYGFDPATCHYVLRRAFVPAEVAGYGADPALSQWMRQAFDAPALAKHFHELGLAPNTDWWFADRAAMFSAMPSAVPMLKAHATIVRLDSRDCPAMAKAIGDVDGARLDQSIDLMAVGPDRKLEAPAPHATRAIYALRTNLDGGPLTLEGAAPALRSLVGPILDAADACETARKG